MQTKYVALWVDSFIRGMNGKLEVSEKIGTQLAMGNSSLVLPERREVSRMKWVIYFKKGKWVYQELSPLYISSSILQI